MCFRAGVSCCSECRDFNCQPSKESEGKNAYGLSYILSPPVFKIQGDGGFRHIGTNYITIKLCATPYDSLYMPSYLQKKCNKTVTEGSSWGKRGLITLNNCLYWFFFFTMTNFKQCICLNRKFTQWLKYIAWYYTEIICFRFVFHSGLPLKQTFKEKGVLQINGNIKKKNVNIIFSTIRAS